ncbi:MAG: class II fructose-bisphosphate aldolase [Anaerolineales bacterium]
MSTSALEHLLEAVDYSLSVHNGGQVGIEDADRLRDTVRHLVAASAFGETDSLQGWARYLVRAAAIKLGIVPASIHALYLARGREDIPHTFTVPAINLRALSFDAARAVFRVAQRMGAGAFIFEIARSEIGYTDQRPVEYATSILGAAIAEGYRGPVFIQGDHFQISAKRYASDPQGEVQAVRDLILEAIQAGFFNIDVDTSTLVNLSQKTIPQQQALNAHLSAELTAFIRQHEPQGVTVSVGGEIGEVGGHNSTEAELRAYMDGYRAALGDAIGLSKISVQTGTSHGGVVLPDGSIARVKVDFDTLHRLSVVARREYGMGGAVQHGASTLPEEAFGKFVESQAIEVHLATNFQNIMYERLEDDLRQDMYAYLDEHHAHERKPDMTDEQFYYKTRKRAIGPFKQSLWNMNPERRAEIALAWEAQFERLFTLLGVGDTRRYVEAHVHAQPVPPDLHHYLGQSLLAEEAGDLAD